jgi:hypothetical protein
VLDSCTATDNRNRTTTVEWCRRAFQCLLITTKHRALIKKLIDRGAYRTYVTKLRTGTARFRNCRIHFEIMRRSAHENKKQTPFVQHGEPFQDRTYDYPRASCASTVQCQYSEWHQSCSLSRGGKQMGERTCTLNTSSHVSDSH